MDVGVGYTTMWMYLMSWTVYLQIVKMVNFMLKPKRTREETVADERLQKCFESWRAFIQKATDLAN